MFRFSHPLIVILMSKTIKINRNKFIEHLARVCSIIERRVDFPSLGFLYSEFSKGSLSLTTSNISMELVTRLDIDSGIDEDFTVLMPALKLFQLCRNIGSEEIELEFTNKTMKLTAGEGQFKMTIMTPEQYPRLEFEEGKDGFEISSEVLLRAIGYTKAFIAPESSRSVLQGVYCELAGNNIVAVATDGHRMSCFQSRVESEAQTKFIIPRRAIHELGTHLKPSKDNVKVEYAGGSVRFSSGEFQLTTRLVEGSYPDFRSVIPEVKSAKPVKVDLSEFSSALKAIDVLVSEATSGVLCEFSKNKLLLKTYNNETDEGEYPVKSSYSGESVDIVFNIKYLFDVLNSINSSEAEIYLQDSSKSCLIKKAKKEEGAPNEVRFVVMPMRL